MSKINIFSLLILIPIVCHGHWDDGYYHEHHDLEARPRWMEKLKDDVQVIHVSIPGTHDSGSLYGGDAVQCQSLTIRQQLDAGIRYLDIRLRHVDNKFAIHHGPFFQHMYFNYVLDQVTGFLTEHPSEFVLMRVKPEHTEQGNTRSFEETFMDYYHQYAAHIWKKNEHQLWEEPPTVGHARGKIVFLQNFAGHRIGLDYHSFDIQDRYHVNTNWDLYSKWTSVKDQIYKAGHAHVDYGFINHLSASGGSFPYFVSSGHTSPGSSAARLATGATTPGWWYLYPDFPRVNCFIGICTIAFEGTNVLVRQFLDNHRPTYVGIIVADFPGAGLIRAVIDCNRNHLEEKILLKKLVSSTKKGHSTA